MRYFSDKQCGGPRKARKALKAAEAKLAELESFLERTDGALGCRGAITGFGVSRTLSVELDRRVVEIATNGPMLWLVADFEWPDFPTDGHGTVRLGTGLFQPEYAARWARELSTFVNALAVAIMAD